MIQSENADMEKNHFLFEVNPNTVEAKSNSDETLPACQWILNIQDSFQGPLLLSLVSLRILFVWSRSLK